MSDAPRPAGVTAAQLAEYLGQFEGMQLTHLEMVEGTDQIKHLRLVDPDPETGGEYEIDGCEVRFRSNQPVFANLVDDVVNFWDDLVSQGRAGLNYVSFTATSRKRPERGSWEVTVRPLSGTKSVGEVNAELKARVVELEAESAALKRQVEHQKRHRLSALQRVKRLQCHVRQILTAHWSASVRVRLLQMLGVLPGHCAGTGALYGITARDGAERVVSQVKELLGFAHGKEARYLRGRVAELEAQVRLLTAWESACNQNENARRKP